MSFMHSEGPRLVLQKIRSMDALFEALRDIPFEAGHPRLVHRPAGDVIVWPRLDRYNQVQIVKREHTFFCTCSEVPTDVGRGSPGLLFSLLGALSKNRQACCALARKTGLQINGLQL